jgi:hypothetical protein
MAPEVNFTNVLCEAFTRTDPKTEKDTEENFTLEKV